MTSEPDTTPTVPIRFPDGTVHHLIDGGDIDLDVEEVYLPDGTRLTEARAEELAEEILEAAGTPLPEHLRRGGRPSLTAPGEHSPQVGFRLPPAMRDAAVAEAARRGVSVSALARQALEQLLADAGARP